MSATDVSILQARVAQLQAQNRSYLNAMRDLSDEYDRQTTGYLQLYSRVSELEAISATHAARVAEPPPLPSADKVLGCTRAQFLKGMEIIMRDTGKTFPEAFALWEIHAAECEEERQTEARANASREGLRAVLGAWLSAGGPPKKALCTCGEADCPTEELVYVEGRGFVDRWNLEKEAEEKAAAEQERQEKAHIRLAQVPKPKKPLTWAERVLAGTK